MVNKTRKSETVKISRLGCMRKSTVEVDMTGSTVEHVEVWVDEPMAQKNQPLVGRGTLSKNRKSD